MARGVGVFQEKTDAWPLPRRWEKYGISKNSKTILNGLFGEQEDTSGELELTKQVG